MSPSAETWLAFTKAAFQKLMASPTMAIVRKSVRDGFFPGCGVFVFTKGVGMLGSRVGFGYLGVGLFCAGTCQASALFQFLSGAMKPVAEKLVDCAGGIKTHAQDAKWLRDVILKGGYADLVRLDVFKLSNLGAECKGLLRGLQARSELMEEESLVNVATTFMNQRALEDAVATWIQASDMQKDVLDAASLAASDEKRSALRQKILQSLNQANEEYHQHREKLSSFWIQHQQVRQELSDMNASLLKAAVDRKDDTNFQSAVKNAIEGLIAA